MACNRCVQVCPTGIDIRQGLQMECIGCTACIDACDDVMTGLTAGEGGRTEFAVEGAKQRIAVIYGPKYPVAVVFAPQGRDFICFEPMTGPTNAFNLKQSGRYSDDNSPELQ